MIYIATGITPNYYERARPYLEDMAQLSSRNNALGVVFCIDFSLPLSVKPLIAPVFVDYSKALQLPKFMLQSGGFADFAPEQWRDDDVIIFTDADARLQREFTFEEKDLFNGIGDLEFLIGRNRPEGGQTLAQEAPCLGPLVPPETLEAFAPGYASMPCRNTGFVVARLSAWRELLFASKVAWPVVAKMLSNPAAVQWMICYIIGSQEMKLGDLPLTIHAHGHLGLAEGVNRREDGRWYYYDTLVAYAHAL